MITDKTVKHTKTNQMMAFVTVEDLLGTVEVVVFPRDYEKNREYLEIDNKVFIRGRVSEEAPDFPSALIVSLGRVFRIVPRTTDFQA